MARCKHRNGEYIELMEACHIRQVEDGIMEKDGTNHIDNISGYLFKCHDCGQYFKVKNRNAKWLQSIINQFGSPGAGNKKTKDL